MTNIINNNDILHRIRWLSVLNCQKINKVVLRVWIILVLTFAFSSWMIYAHCDDRNLGGIPDEHINHGWKIWQEKNCQACHQVYGLGGYMGPDLTNSISQKGKGSNYIKTFIQYGTGRMPNFHLDDNEVNDLILYLSWVDKSGKSMVPETAVRWNGTTELK